MEQERRETEERLAQEREEEEQRLAQEQLQLEAEELEVSISMYLLIGCRKFLERGRWSDFSGRGPSI